MKLYKHTDKLRVFVLANNRQTDYREKGANYGTHQKDVTGDGHFRRQD